MPTDLERVFAQKRKAQREKETERQTDITMLSACVIICAGVCRQQLCPSTGRIVPGRTDGPLLSTLFHFIARLSGSLAILAAVRRASSLVTSSTADPIGCPLFLLSPKEAAYPGRKAMDWFKQKTSIAGVQVSNWMIVLGAIIIVLLIFQNLH